MFERTKMFLLGHCPDGFLPTYTTDRYGIIFFVIIDFELTDVSCNIKMYGVTCNTHVYVFKLPVVFDFLLTL